MSTSCTSCNGLALVLIGVDVSSRKVLKPYELVSQGEESASYLDKIIKSLW